MLRYQESRERSAELLRRVLHLMGQHDAPFNPISFAVWYEFVSGMNLQLAQAIEMALQTATRLDAESMLTLYQDHVADADPSAMQKIATALQLMMAGMNVAASQVGERAGAFGDQLQSLTQALSEPAPDALTPLLSQVLAQATQMQQTVQAFAQQVASSQHEIERLQGELIRVRDEAVVDQLTRVLNRRGFDLQLADLLQQPVAPERCHGLIMLDIDHFKHVNDQHGHVMGDRILQATADVLRACVQGKGPTVARYGGEEFAILLPNSTLADAMALAQLVLQRVRAMRIRDRRTQAVVTTITVSGGVAILQPGDDAAKVTSRADDALYRSKRDGRDRICQA